MTVYVVVPAQQGSGFVVESAVAVQVDHLAVPVVEETVD